MPNRGEKERNVRSLMLSAGGSFMVTLPLEYVKALKWKERQKLSVELTREGMIIRELKKSR